MKKAMKEFYNDFMKQVDDIKSGRIKKQIPNILTFSRALAPFIIIPTIMLGNLKLAILELVFFIITFPFITLSCNNYVYYDSNGIYSNRYF